MSSREASERAQRQESNAQIIEEEKSSLELPQYEEGKYRYDDVSIMEKRLIKVILSYIDDDGSQHTMRSNQFKTNDYKETSDMLKIKIEKAKIFALLRQKEIKADDIIIEFSIGSRNVICNYKEEYIEIVKNEDEVPIIDEFSNKESMIILFIKKKKNDKEEVDEPPKQLYSENRNAGLHNENAPDLRLKDHVIAVKQKEKEEEGPKNDSPQNNPKEEELTWDIQQFQNRIRDSKVDLVFLSSDPLVYKQKNGENIFEYESPLNTENEFKQICQQIKSTKKQFTIMRDIATRAKLIEAFNEKPLMLHISCHGDVEEKQGDLQYYLLFEKSDEYCLRENIYEVTIKEALQIQKQKSLAIVFVSACHSEGIAKLFKRCGVPIVIAINSLAQVNDKAAIKFAEEFYKQIVIGQTPQQSFDHARSMVLADGQIPFYSCCCHHKHESWCRWDTEFPQNNAEKRSLGHQKHCHKYSLCNCEKKESNMHQKDCKFYKQFNRDCCPQGQDFQNFYIADKDGNIQLCCCQSGEDAQRAHKEDQKFKIIKSEGNVSQSQKLYEEQVLNTALFNRQDGGRLKVQWNHKKKDQLMKHQPEFIIGRHGYIHKIFEFIHNKDGKQFLHIYGQSGQCKTYIANYAAKYALYGRSDLDGAIYILAEEARNSKQLFKLICKKLCDEKLVKPKLQSIESFVLNQLATRKLVIIFDGMQNVVNYEKNNKKQPWISFKQLIASGKKCKFIAISSNKDDFNGIDVLFNEQIQILELTPLKAARLLIYTTNDIDYLDRKVNETVLAEHKFLKSKLFTLRPIILLNLVKNNKIQDLVKMRTDQIEQKLKEAQLNHQPTEVYEKQLKRLKDSKQEEEKGDSFKKIESSSSEQCTTQDLIEINMGSALSTYDYFTNQNLLQLASILEVSKHRVEYQLFIMTCIAPEGFLESDIDEICAVNNLPVKWRDFFEKVSSQQAQEVYFLEINFQGSNEEVEKDGSSQKDNKIPIFFDLQKRDDLQKKRNHYLPIKIVCDHFSQNYIDIIRSINIPDFFTMMMKYMAVLARDVIEITVSQLQQQNITPIDCICAAKNQGIWKQEFEIIEDEQQKKKRLHKNRVLSYNMHEKMVLIRMLNIDNIKSHFDLKYQSESLMQMGPTSINYQEDEVSKYICDFCISAVSLMMINDNYYDAWEIIMKICEPIAIEFKFDLFRAKLLLLKASLGILIDDTVECIKLVNELKDIEDILQTSYLNDASVYAEYYYLQAKLKMKLISNLYQNPDNSSYQLVQNENAKESELQKTPQQMMERGQPRTSQIEEEKKQFDSLSPTRTPTQPQQMNQLLGKSTSFETVTSQASGKKDFNIGEIEKEIHLNLREAKQNYCAYDGIANCLLSEAEFNMSTIGQRLYFREQDDTKSEVNSKDKNLLQASDQSDLVDLKKFEKYFNQHAETLNFAKAQYAKLRRKDLEAKTFTLMGLLWTMRFDQYIKEDQQKLEKEKLRSYIKRAVDYYEKAQQLYQATTIQIDQKVYNVSDLIQMAYEKSYLLQDNLVFLANSFPLLDSEQKQSSTSIQNKKQLEIGPLTQYQHNFAEIFKTIAEKSQVSICMKQEFLNKSSIEQTVQYKIKILHLQSQIASSQELCIEGENARAKYIMKLNILTDFSFQDSKNNFDRTYLKADLVVLAMPISLKLAKQFIKMNVQHVVAFNFESVMQDSALNIMFMINEYIMKFCQSLYSFILSRELTVTEAFMKAESANEEVLDNIIVCFIKQEEVSAKFNKLALNIKQLSQELKSKIRPLLFPAKDAEGYIFGKLPTNPIKLSSTTNLIVDSSRPLPQSNIDSYLKTDMHRSPFTGRKSLMQQIFENIQNPSVNILEVNGESGIGKTRLALESADYLRKRYKFQKGIFYLDLKGVKTIEELQYRVFQYDKLQFNNDKIDKNDKYCHQFCLIFDNLEDITFDTEYLTYTLKSISQIYTNAKIIVISKENLFSQQNVYSLVVQSLNPDESIEFVSSNCKLNLVDNLMQIIENQQNNFGKVSLDLSSLKGYLLSHPAIIDLNGNPEYLLELCRIFENKGTTEYSKILEVVQDLNIKYKAVKKESKQQMSSNRTYHMNQNREETSSISEQYSLQTDYKGANWFREGETFNIVPHNPGFPPLEEEKISNSLRNREPKLYLSHNNDDDRREPMGYVGVFGHLNQPHSSMSGGHSDLNPEPLNQEEIDLQRAIEESRRLAGL